MEAIKNNSIVSSVGIDIGTTRRTAVNAAIDIFAIDQGHVTLPDDLCPLDALSSILRNISSVFELDVSADLDLTCRNILHRILQFIFDTNTQSALEEDSEIFAHLSSKQKARILAQAIAAFTVIFQRLAQTGEKVTYGVLNREAQLFTESDQRALMQSLIEGDAVFENCTRKSDIAEAILSAIDADEDAATPQPVAADDKQDFMFSPSAAQEHKNMGVPWGFSIMAIN
ncbi:hypothetical protein NOF04DRAFT_1329169 [Fusarium oxysporum II5]|uniref:Uncharacterized protein n=3 Tax=Fusarium oxysporum species complex TaxID=171631 RepID=N1SBF2_FUSC4|nr:uncharacterized protein FOIG_07570 [Fusarium odoratissimum NRRL 54006]EMT73390.1 hypothetical protein FOC4_g10004762 [Fusarium odoratissimum]EXM00590.1 hypothetical protein FOIG_07570 [Fusarium odoratissimum NRRL 54006]KAK2127464.1 hypothetical protein NOF04DRAFT_1329169 [Fusarium oxysporum II5]TXB98130.1 hypothetical protein FocTR4_00013367 [Fusarium oxysporum f. sp. cubense]